MNSVNATATTAQRRGAGPAFAVVATPTPNQAWATAQEGVETTGGMLLAQRVPLITGLERPDTGSTCQASGDIVHALAKARGNVLDDANAPLEDRQWVISPAQKAGFFALSQFVNKDYEKLNSEVRGKGATRAHIGNWMDVPVYQSVNTEGTRALVPLAA